ncbi:hypothetical protein XU18_0581 [Perkinsela sp. CCAP 1560/4]|nr:hypothetical protein XU18_4344 [Perkinsela sp. CCAP 1560/4]KNH09161.1 hypothetical protein XU18_0581 [Perkinsela sp. CCAP 1560/4]|eukprot:KNH04377.1 hypothetical protein XU18_4344 [Perkinsela sp. CCAP 1560/4]
MRSSRLRWLIHTSVSSETLSQLRPWVRFSQFEQQTKPHDIATVVVREFEEFRGRHEPLMKYIVRKDEVSLVGMYLVRAYALLGAGKTKLKALVDLILGCNSPLYRNELWNTFLSCLCESPDIVDVSFINGLQEQMDFYNIGANATTYMYLIALTLQAGQDPMPLYSKMISDGITPSTAMFKSVLQTMSRCFPDNEIIIEIATFFLSNDLSDENLSFPLQRLTLWLLWIAKDASLSPSLLPMLLQLLMKQVKKLPDPQKESNGEKKEKSLEENTSKEHEMLGTLLKLPVLRQMEHHCWWFRDIASFDSISKLLPPSIGKELDSTRDPIPMVCTLFASGNIERGMQVLHETDWEGQHEESTRKSSFPSSVFDKRERRIELLAAELITTSAVDRAYYFLEELHKKNVSVNLGALNIIICACSLQGDEVRAIETAEAIECFNLKPDSSTFKYLIWQSGPFQMRENTVTELLAMMNTLGIHRTPSIIHLAVQQLVWLDFISEALDLTVESIRSDCIGWKTVAHLVRRLVYLGDMHSASEVMCQAMEGSLKDKFPPHFVQFVAIRTQSQHLKSLMTTK